MGITFNADEIFEMAEQIERNGAAFYREAAGRAPNPSMREMMLQMAEMEDRHLEKFKQMRTELKGREQGPTVFDPDNQAAQYLRVMADGHGCEGAKSPLEKLSGKESPRELLEIALNSEKESVVFYFGLRSLVPERAGRDKVEAVIHEELGHIASLHEQLAALG